MRFLEYAYQSHGGFGRTITIGRQQLTFPAREVFGYLGVSAVSPDLPFVDDLIARAFGASEVASIDASSFEGATYVRDLNKPLEVGFPQFDTVIDGGSLEHIFDVRASLANVAAICATGGQILHIVPANNFMGHGFYQFRPNSSSASTPATGVYRNLGVPGGSGESAALVAGSIARHPRVPAGHSHVASRDLPAGACTQDWRPRYSGDPAIRLSGGLER